jgi:hypothetical protein
MAYPTIDAPYGFKPVNLIGGQVFAGSTRNIPIAYNYGTAIYYGDFVNIASGFCAVVANTIATPTVGVFLGCYYTNPTTKQRLWSQYYPGSVTAGDITAIVGDDPDAVFRVAVTASAASAVIASASALNVGINMAGGTVAGSASTGNSGGAVVALATTAGNFRVMNLVPDTQTSTGAAYVSGTGTTTLTVSGLTVGQVLPIGTDVWQLVSGQLQFTGSTLTAAATVSSATSQALTVTASTVTTAGTLALIQTPEVLVKITFGSHRYYVA